MGGGREGERERGSEGDRRRWREREGGERERDRERETYPAPMSSTAGRGGVHEGNVCPLKTPRRSLHLLPVSLMVCRLH